MYHLLALKRFLKQLFVKPSSNKYMAQKKLLIIKNMLHSRIFLF